MGVSGENVGLISNGGNFHLEYVEEKNYIICIEKICSNLRSLYYQVGFEVRKNYGQITINIIEGLDEKIINIRKINLFKNNDVYIAKKFSKNITEDYIAHLITYTKYHFKSMQLNKSQNNYQSDFFESLYNIADLIFNEIPVEETNDIDEADLTSLLKCSILFNFFRRDVGLDFLTIRKIILNREIGEDYFTTSSSVYVKYSREKHKKLYEKEKQALEILAKKRTTDNYYYLRLLILEKIRDNAIKHNIYNNRSKFYITFCDDEYVLEYNFDTLNINTNYLKISYELISLIDEKYKQNIFFENGKFLYEKWKEFIKENTETIRDIVVRNSDFDVNIKEEYEKCKEVIENTLDEFLV